MARGKSGGLMYPNPLNETTGGDAPDTNDLYFDLNEVIAVHLQTGDLDSTPNSRGSEDMLGGPAPGEPSPYLKK